MSTENGGPPSDQLTFPPGFVGDLGRQIYESSLRPVVEVSVAAVLGLMAGIVGRQFNTPTATGLNLYLLVVGKTGIGKEGGASGINRIMHALRDPLIGGIPRAMEFLGPGHFPSGQGLIRALDKQACMVAVQGEFGHVIHALSDPYANSNSLMLRRVLLELHNLSGRGQVLHPSAYSDLQKNTTQVFSPALTILGDTTPDVFYANISEEAVATGFLPRFLILEHDGDRPPLNKQANTPPPASYIRWLARIANRVLSMAADHSIQDVRYSPAAQLMLDQFNDSVDEEIKGSPTDGFRQLWNRAHLKALRVASILAVGDNPGDPVISPEAAMWAMELVLRDVSTLERRFEAGDVGQGSSKQVADLQRILEEYLRRPFEELEHYGVTDRKVYAQGYIPYTYIYRRATALASFKREKPRETEALQRALKVLEHQGLLAELTVMQVAQITKNRQRLFSLVANNG